MIDLNLSICVMNGHIYGRYKCFLLHTIEENITCERCCFLGS